MTQSQHLLMEETALPPGIEGSFGSRGWCCVRVTTGVGYLLQKSSIQELGVGDLVVIRSEEHCILRASQLGELGLQRFYVYPDLLAGILTLSERRCLEFVQQRGFI